MTLSILSNCDTHVLHLVLFSFSSEATEHFPIFQISFPTWWTLSECINQHFDAWTNIPSWTMDQLSLFELGNLLFSHISKNKNNILLFTYRMFDVHVNDFPGFSLQILRRLICRWLESCHNSIFLFLWHFCYMLKTLYFLFALSRKTFLLGFRTCK